MRHDNFAGALVTLMCLMVFAVVFVIYTTRYLPENVATHFGTGNRADGWMSRNNYLLFTLAFVVGMPALVSMLVGTLPRKFPQWTNIPNRDYWLAPQRIDDSVSFLSAHGKRLGSLMVLMMTAMHYAILQANLLKPPMLPGRTFFSIISAFALALIWWIVRLYRRFPKPA